MQPSRSKPLALWAANNPRGLLSPRQRHEGHKLPVVGAGRLPIPLGLVARPRAAGLTHQGLAPPATAQLRAHWAPQHPSHARGQLRSSASYAGAMWVVCQRRTHLLPVLVSNSESRLLMRTGLGISVTLKNGYPGNGKGRGTRLAGALWDDGCGAVWSQQCVLGCGLPVCVVVACQVLCTVHTVIAGWPSQGPLGKNEVWVRPNARRQTWQI
jgi:hypothetical protein